jgi:IS30 family transposase
VSHLINQPRTKRRYSLEEKAQLFLAFERLGTMSAASREVGFPMITCYHWCVKAGLITVVSRPRRWEKYLQLRAGGFTRREATLETGVHERSARDWDQGIVRSHNTRVYPDGRIIDCNKGVTNNHKVDGVSLLILQRKLSPRFLSLIDTEKSRDLHTSGVSVRSIAASMGRAPLTISREPRRNRKGPQTYEPCATHRYSAKRRLRPKERKLVTCPQLKDLVQNELDIHWPPEQICTL